MRSFCIKVVLMAALTGLLGCGVLKKRKNPPQMISQVALEESVEQGVESRALTLGRWPSAAWWEMFGDDQLARLMQRALADNPDLKRAIARVQGAREQAKEVRAALLPHLGAFFKDDYQHLSKDSLYRFPPSKVPAVVNQVFLGLSFEYEIDLFGKNRAKYRAALGEFKAQRAEMAQAFLMITIAVAEAYFTYQTHLLHIELREEEVEERKELFELTQQRVAFGLDNVIALEERRVAWQGAQERLISVEKALALSRHQMHALLGMSPDDPLDLSLPKARFDAPFPLPENLPIELVSRRPDLMAQIWRVEAAARRIGAAKAAFFPNINLTGFGRLETLSWSLLFSVDSLAGSIAPALTLPLFTGGQLTAALQKERASFDVAVHDYNSLVLKAAREVADAVKTFSAVTDQKEVQRAVVEEQNAITYLTSERVRFGLDDRLALLEAKLAAVAQTVRAIDLQYQRYVGVLRLVRALGGGYRSDKEASE